MSLSSAELTALQSGSVQLGIFFRLATDPVLRLWLGIGGFPLTSDSQSVLDTSGDVYQGAGQLINVPAFQQLTNGTAEVATFSLSGVTQEIIGIVSSNSALVQGKNCNVGYGLFDQNWKLLGSIHWAWQTIADFVSVDQQPQADVSQPIIRTVSLSVSSVFAGRRRRGFSYLTDQDQQRRSPGDNFCLRTVEYSMLSSKTWPRF